MISNSINSISLCIGFNERHYHKNFTEIQVYIYFPNERARERNFDRNQTQNVTHISQLTPDSES